VARRERALHDCVEDGRSVGCAALGHEPEGDEQERGGVAIAGGLQGVQDLARALELPGFQTGSRSRAQVRVLVREEGAERGGA
jgi:hypothetical protein